MHRSTQNTHSCSGRIYLSMCCSALTKLKHHPNRLSSPALSSSPLLSCFPLISLMPGTYYVLLNTDCPFGTITSMQALCPPGAIAGMFLWGQCCLHSMGRGRAAPQPRGWAGWELPFTWQWAWPQVSSVTSVQHCWDISLVPCEFACL